MGTTGKSPASPCGSFTPAFPDPMKIHSIKIANYRIHRAFESAFDPSLTLIGGPNESGKSTLADAVFHALFLRSKRTGADLEKMTSRAGGHPSIELAFEASGQTYTVRKTFRGAQGTTALSASGGASWNGDAAEEKLLEICGIPAAAGRTIPSQWEHLWVRQGESGSDPSALATGQKDALLLRLQTTGAAALIQSDLDARVADGVAAELARLVTGRGPKAGSELDLAGKSAAAAATASEEAAAVCASLDHAVGDFEQATRELAEAGRNLASLGGDLLKTRQMLLRVRELQSLQEKQAFAVRTRAQELEALASGDASIKEIAGKIRSESDALAPREAGLTQKLEAEAAARKAHADAESAHAAAGQGLRSARIRLDLAALYVKRFEQAARAEGLRERTAQARALRSQLAALPAVTPAQVKALEKLDRDREKLAGVLAAISTRIEILASELPVQADGQPLAPGVALEFSHDAEISIGTVARFRITPGGGAGLAETRHNLAKAEAAVQNQLDQLGVPSLAEAAAASARRLEIGVRLEGTESLEQVLAEAESATNATEEDIRRREVPDFSPPADAPSAFAIQSACQIACDEAAAIEKASAVALKKGFQDLDAAAQSAQEFRTGLQQSRTMLEGLNGRLAQLVSTHGDDAARSARLAGLIQTKDLAEAELSGTQKSLDALQPAILEADEERLSRAVTQNQSLKSLAGERLAVAAATLRREGTSDPQADLARAAASERSAQERLATAKRHADAIALLDSLFSAEQQALTDQLTKPLADRVSGYLQCLFGPAAEAGVTLTDGAFKALTLIRPDSDAFEFSALSGGTREQVAVAFRLAMAEILAQNHGGCLPVFLDDALTNSDADRVAGLQRMLDLAARRGLQVIILSCSPGDYAALGARTITLPGRPGAPAPSLTPPAPG